MKKNTKSIKTNAGTGIFVQNVRYALDNAKGNSPRNQRELSKFSGISESILSTILNEGRNITLNECLSISNALNVPLPALLDERFNIFHNCPDMSISIIEKFIKKIIADTKAKKLFWTESGLFHFYPERYLSNIKKLYIYEEEEYTEEALIRQNVDIKNICFKYYYIPDEGVSEWMVPQKYYSTTLANGIKFIIINGLIYRNDEYQSAYYLIIKKSDDEQVVCVRYSDECTIPSNVFDELLYLIENNKAIIPLSVTSFSVIKHYLKKEPKENKKDS